jgi:uncharacterized protein YlxW (UPF0749 family)
MGELGKELVSLMIPEISQLRDMTILLRGRNNAQRKELNRLQETEKKLKRERDFLKEVLNDQVAKEKGAGQRVAEKKGAGWDKDINGKQGSGDGNARGCC